MLDTILLIAGLIGATVILLFTFMGAMTVWFLLVPHDCGSHTNRVRLWWFALTQPETLACAYPFIAIDEPEEETRL